ncbi:hypothetical protein F3J23_16815 [Chryseobacterium sp. Tr-659]|uniref:Nmad2 family putative nucleotide modification protein n=1 Tax=Chryseobacterium sp. Tr-659 TaxID=2608340 RepID=UPI0014219284|nr:hypothetical protein [Chryseobacterium sp. Tr-659]NIF07101.1 hypothetical protein [Chryseobacterium sp. Tr-659]
MKIYSYVVDHDLGLAPNPFGNYCTLAVCKPNIRKSKKLNIGDWIVGTGSKALENIAKRPYISYLIYAMKITEIIPFESYWEDPRFQYKKPTVNGSLVTMYGDNFYHKVGDKWIQENSAHSNSNGSVNDKHLKTDIEGKNVLISDSFYYFGNNALKIPNEFLEACHTGIGQKIVPESITDKFIEWLINHKKGINGDPINWKQHSNLKILI